MPNNNENAPKWEVTGETLLNSEEKELPMLVEKLLPKVAIGALGGQSDIGKSTFLLCLALSVVKNEEYFLGFKMNVKHQSAIYVSTEDDQHTVGSKLRKCVSAAAENFAPLRFIFETDNLITRLEQSLRAKPVDLIVLDTFGDIFMGEVNASNAVRPFLNQFYELGKKYECAILFNHHTGKGKEEGVPSKNHLLGSQGFEAKMRLVMLLIADNKNDSIRHLCVVKGNHLPPSEKTKSYELTFNGFEYGFTGKRVDNNLLAKKDENEESSVIQIILSLKQEGKTLREIEDILIGKGIKGFKKTRIGEILKGNSNADDSEGKEVVES